MSHSYSHPRRARDLRNKIVVQLTCGEQGGIFSRAARWWRTETPRTALGNGVERKGERGVRAWGANSCVRWETEQGGKGGENVGRGAGGRWHGVDCAPADPWLCAVGKSCACGGNGKSHVINDFLTAMYLPPLTVPQ